MPILPFTNNRLLITSKSVEACFIFSISFLFLYLVHMTWFKWPDVMIDYGRELYVPWRLSEGQVLYRDLFHFYGPLAQYVNAALFSIFGVDIKVLVYFNLLCVSVIMAIGYVYIRSLFGSLTSFFCLLSFLSMFCFAQYSLTGNYNYITPYCHEITYGIYLFIISLFFYYRYEQERRGYLLFLIFFFHGLIFLTKLEVFIASSASLVMFLFFTLKEKNYRSFTSLILISCAGFCSSLIPFLAILIQDMSLSNAFLFVSSSLYSLFKLTNLSSNVFFKYISGFDNIYSSVYIMMTILLFESIAFLIMILTARILSKYIYAKLYIYLLLPSLLLLLYLLVSYQNFISWLDLARPLPLLLFVALVYLVIKRYNGNNNVLSSHLSFIIAITFALVLMLKIVLNVRIYHYGFALAMPAIIIMIILLFVSPSLNNSTRIYAPLLLSFIALFLLFTFYKHISYTSQIMSIKTTTVGNQEENIITYDPRFSDKGAVAQKAINIIQSNKIPSDTFAVLPEGVMLNYLTRTPNPMKYFVSTPPFVTGDDEAIFIEELKKKAPTYILVTNQDSIEYGRHHFGSDYAINIMTWINANYRHIDTIGMNIANDEHYRIIIYRKYAP